MKVGVIGASGQVGTVMRAILRERKFPVNEIRFFGSSRSAGTTLEWSGDSIVIEDAATADFSGIDVALMSSGATSSRQIAPKLAAAGALVIDNSSAWRMDNDVPLIVAAVNSDALSRVPKRIVANPNCTTMAAMPVLMPLHREAGLRSLTVATYQSVSGSGLKGVSELADQLEASMNSDVRVLTFDGSALSCATPVVFPGPVAHNVLPLAGHIEPDGSFETNEEQKFRNESRKILSIDSLLVSVTCVRVPVFCGHSLAITASFDRPLSPERAMELLGDSPGVVLCDLPTPLVAAGTDPSYVGRVRRAESVQNGLSLFVVADNLRQGAALNAVQIAEAWRSRRD